MENKSLSKKLRIDKQCISCGLCVAICPCNNLSMQQGVVMPQNNCTLCYRCVNACPQKAIHILGKTVHQYKGISVSSGGKQN